MITNDQITLQVLEALIRADSDAERGYLTAASLVDSGSNVVFNQASQLYTVGTALGGIFQNPTYLGGANAGDNWPAGWTVGLTGALTP